MILFVCLFFNTIPIPMLWLKTLWVEDLDTVPVCSIENRRPQTTNSHDHHGSEESPAQRGMFLSMSKHLNSQGTRHASGDAFPPWPARPPFGT